MEQVKVRVFDPSQDQTIMSYTGVTEDGAIRFYDDEKYLNTISFRQDRILIKREAKDYRSLIYLSEHKSRAKIYSDLGEWEIDIRMITFESDENLIKAVYDTGQLLAIAIEFIKE